MLDMVDEAEQGKNPRKSGILTNLRERRQEALRQPLQERADPVSQDQFYPRERVAHEEARLRVLSGMSDYCSFSKRLLFDYCNFPGFFL